MIFSSNRPLQKMCAGGFLAAFAYVVAGFLSIKLEVGDLALCTLMISSHNLLRCHPQAMAPVLPSGAHTQIRFINVAPCHIIIQSDFIQTNLTYGDVSSDISVFIKTLHVCFV